MILDFQVSSQPSDQIFFSQVNKAELSNKPKVFKEFLQDSPDLFLLQICQA